MCACIIGVIKVFKGVKVNSMIYLFIFHTRFSKIKKKLWHPRSHLPGFPAQKERGKRGRERYRSAVGPIGRNSQGNWGLGKSVREREKGRGGAKMLKVRGVKAAAQKWRGKGIGGKGKKSESLCIHLCVCV